MSADLEDVPDVLSRSRTYEDRGCALTLMARGRAPREDRWPAWVESGYCQVLRLPATFLGPQAARSVLDGHLRALRANAPAARSR